VKEACKCDSNDDKLKLIAAEKPHYEYIVRMTQLHLRPPSARPAT